MHSTSVHDPKSWRPYFGIKPCPYASTHSRFTRAAYLVQGFTQATYPVVLCTKKLVCNLMHSMSARRGFPRGGNLAFTSLSIMEAEPSPPFTSEPLWALIQALESINRW